MKRFVAMLLLILELVGLCGCGQGTVISHGNEQAKPTSYVVAPKANAVPLGKRVVTAPSVKKSPENLETLFRGLSDDQKKALIQNQNDRHNSAEYIIANGWIYGLFFEKEKPTFTKWRYNMSDKTKLTGGSVHYPYVKDAFIYGFFNDGDKKNGIYRMRVSGNDLQKLSDGNGVIQIWKDTIFFNNNGNRLYRMDLDGANVRIVIDKPVYYWFVFGDTILYQDDADNESLHLWTSDGNDLKLNNDKSYWPIYDGQYIYYVKSLSDVRSIWRIGIDGTGDTLIANYPVSEGMALYDNKIYFVYGDDDDRIYSINKDGSGLTLISQDKNCGHIQFMGDMLKYNVEIWKNGTYYIDLIKLCEPDGTTIRVLHESK